MEDGLLTQKKRARHLLFIVREGVSGEVGANVHAGN